MQNDGILHHFVRGSHDRALQQVTTYSKDIKTKIRLIVTFILVASIYAAVRRALGILWLVPYFETIADYGAFTVALIVGLPLAITAISLGFIAANPLLLCTLLSGGFYKFYSARKQSKELRKNDRKEIAKTFEVALKSHSVAEIEFFEFAKLSAIDGQLQPDQRKQLFAWGQENGWGISQCEDLFNEALTELRAGPAPSPTVALSQLVKLAMADGKLSTTEVKLIKSVANQLGLCERGIRQLILDAHKAKPALELQPIAKRDTAIS